MGNCSSATLTQNSSVRGVFRMGIARETSKTRQAPESCSGPSVCAGSSGWELIAAMGRQLTSRHSLAVTPIFSDDLWQISVTRKATALEKQVTCPWLKTRLDSKVKELLHSSWLTGATQTAQLSSPCEARMWGNKSHQTRDHDNRTLKFWKQKLPLPSLRSACCFHAGTTVS